MVSSLPTVSFVIASFNRGPVLIDCLQRVVACGLPTSHFDVRVIDNGSTDGTGELVEAFCRTHANVTLTKLGKNCGPVAKNVGLVGNPADILVVLDDDAYPEPGAVMQMLRHFAEDRQLGAAVFDVRLPDGTREASAYPNVFIGAGTALRGEAVRGLKGAPLPAEFFMQAEEYDLSFRLLEAGWRVQRFWDMPLVHLKSPGARIGQRTTRLDVRNNLYLLARYVPAPLCFELAADWLARYWRMAVARDLVQPAHEVFGTHKRAFMAGAAEGMARWGAQRGRGSLLGAGTVEEIFKFEGIARRMRQAKERLRLKRIVLGDWGKNMLPYLRAAEGAGVEVVGVLDENLGGAGVEYRGLEVCGMAAARERGWLEEAVVLTVVSPVHAERRRGALERVGVRVVDLFSRRGAVASV